MVFAFALDTFAQSELVIPVLVPLVVSGTAIALMGGAAVAFPLDKVQSSRATAEPPKGGHKQKQKGCSFNKSKAGKKKAQRAQQTARTPPRLSSSHPLPYRRLCHLCCLFLLLLVRLLPRGSLGIMVGRL